MNIALFGYGKMGKAIEEIALAKGHTIRLSIDNEQQWVANKALLSTVDVAIDFSTPQAVLTNIERCFEAKVPIVVGTTAWYNAIPKLKVKCKQENQSLLWASNFSIGVNIFFKINKELARLMNTYPDYSVAVEEIHHSGKLDAPSGTAISIANDIIEEIDRKNKWILGESNKADELSITAKRIDPIPGTHQVIYDSEIDTIEIIHSAKSRKGFAKGAILAAEWIINHKGFYEFKEVFF